VAKSGPKKRNLDVPYAFWWKLTPHTPYFADTQSNFEGVTKNILGSLDDAVGLIAVMHHRGRVIFPDRTEYIRASVWIEQEIAIAAYITQVLGRTLKVAAFVEEGIRLEGLREKILLNPHYFKADSEVLTHLEQILPNWKDLPVTLKVSGPPKLRFQLERGDVTNYLFKFENEEDEEIFIHQICSEVRRHRTNTTFETELPSRMEAPPAFLTTNWESDRASDESGCCLGRDRRRQT
jgi:hypothetical protein